MLDGREAVHGRSVCPQRIERLPDFLRVWNRLAYECGQ